MRNNQMKIARLMEEYETLDAVVVSGSAITDMDEWLVQPKKRRRAVEVKCDPLDNTQTTDNSHRSQSSVGDSQISDAASEALAQGEFSDDFTGEDEEDEDAVRSVDTRTGLPDSQITDRSYDDYKEKKKRKKKAKKAEKKEAKRTRNRGKEKVLAEKKSGTNRRTTSPPRSPSY